MQVNGVQLERGAQFVELVYKKKQVEKKREREESLAPLTNRRKQLGLRASSSQVASLEYSIGGVRCGEERRGGEGRGGEREDEAVRHRSAQRTCLE